VSRHQKGKDPKI
jgi:hypothetical protein